VSDLSLRRIAKNFPGAIHISIDSGPDDRDEYSLEGDDVPCCMAGAMRGPRACTCWTPVYDLEQADPDLSTQPVTRETCCHDCAYRNGSPERAEGYDGELQDIAGDGSRFACHQGMRRVVAWRHPDGREIPAAEGDYEPPIIGLVTFRADGTPADYCAGWAAHRRALLGADA
jgi:hypothetical protein